MKPEKNLAIILRKKGKSYNEITKIIGLPKSTLSSWLKNIKMPEKIRLAFWNRIRKKQASSITKFNRKRAEKAKNEAKYIKNNATNAINKISSNDLLLIGASLYWAEGYKKNRWTSIFSNSDPLMIKLIMRFFREICNAKKEKIKATVHTHSNIDPESAINYWSKISGIPKKQFLKCYLKISPSSKQKRPYNTLPYGTLRISIYDYKITNKIKGWIEGISKKM